MKLIATKYNQGIGLFGFEENHLVEVNIYNNNQQVCIGDIYLGRVNNVVTNINAYFVQIGDGKEVFLPFTETTKTLKSGECVLVQIKKEASKGKQAMATTHLSIAGLYCVVNYEYPAVVVSTKLESEQRKYWKDSLKALLVSDEILPEDREILSKYCLIVRTNVLEAKSQTEVVNEWLTLAKQLDFVVTKGCYQSLFTKLYCEEQRYISHIKDIPQNYLEEIITDDNTIFKELKNAFGENADIQGKIRLYNDEFSLQKLYSLEVKLNEALNKKVWLKSGGFLMIEPTEALTVIDVNSGKFDKKGDAEVYYKKVNEEAALEIIRQIKLRNISGIIIIDFINMSSEESKKELLELLSNLASKDKVKTRVMGMTSLGLVEMTRTKIEKPLWEQVLE